METLYEPEVREALVGVMTGDWISNAGEVLERAGITDRSRMIRRYVVQVLREEGWEYKSIRLGVGGKVGKAWRNTRRLKTLDGLRAPRGGNGIEPAM